MRQFTTQGIVLLRTDFGEADRIITFLTPDHGKVKAIAKGVRKSKAKLAGSVEPFGVSDLSFIVGRGEINTLTSARLVRNYGNIVKNLERTNAAYEAMRLIDKTTEDNPEEAFFNLLDMALESIDEQDASLELTELWFKLQLLKLSGHAPNFQHDEARRKLNEKQHHGFDFDKMCFRTEPKGKFDSRDIKFLRLGLAAASPKVLSRVKNIDGKLINKSLNLINLLANAHVPS